MRATAPMEETDPLWDEFLGLVDTAASPLPRETFAGARVLITGAGGSIGSAIARDLAACSPAQLVLVDASEHGLYRLQQQLMTCAPASLEPALLLGNVTDSAFLREVFAVHAPEIVFHAAAVKHVPLAEANPLAAAETNILGTRLVLHYAVATGARSVLHLSTDKAVEPISVLGVTKRVAELLVLAHRSPTVVSAVRLPNVLGSSGSVGPLFLEQVARRVPLTVTAPDASRYFLSLRQTVAALIQAAALQTPGILVPSVGPPRRIIDLARFIDARRGEAAEVHTPIEFTGLRAGDKLKERLLSETERAVPIKSSGLSLVEDSADLAPDLLEQAFTQVRRAIADRDRDLLFGALGHAVAGYARAAPPHMPPTREVCESPA